MEIFLLLPIIFLVFAGFVYSDSTELPTKLSRRGTLSQYGEDIQYIVEKLHEKFIDALGPSLKSCKKLPWNQVEIVSGWPSSVYLLEPTFWCKHDIQVMKAAVDSIQMRANTEEDLPPPALVLHTKLIVECERLNLMKAKRYIIDWRRIAANTDGLRITTTHFRKWNAQDRRMAVRLLERLRSIEDGSELQEHSPVNENSVSLILDDLSKGLQSAQKRNRENNKRKREATSETIKDAQPTETVKDDADKEMSVERAKEIDTNAPINQSIEDENLEPEDNEYLFDEIPSDQQSDEQPTFLPSFYRSHSELQLAQYLDVMEQLIEDAQLESLFID